MFILAGNPNNKFKIMKNKNWNLKGGILIIGSLLWQDYLFTKGDNIRIKWRNLHLDYNNRIPVKLPIRYGRMSGSNPKIATMVFSNRMKNKKGVGFIVPFKNRINNQEELLDEAKALSNAEGMNGNFVCNWGVLSYLLNKNIIQDNIKKEIIKLFRNNRRNMIFNIKDFKVDRERSCLTKSQKLDIDWIEASHPNDQKKADKFHFLLATVTKPKKNPPLTIKDIATTIKSDVNRKYFINNLINGIKTYEDFEISKLINE